MDKIMQYRKIVGTKESIIFIVLFILFVAVCRHYFFYTDKVYEGSAYGFEIGLSKDDVIKVLNKNHFDEILVLSSPINKNDTSGAIYITVNNIDSVLFKNMDIWSVKFNNSVKNVLVLSFIDNKLVTIFRYRRAYIF